MCGIVGIIGVNNQRKSAVLIQKMTDKIAHRGPDSDGSFIFDEGALGHRRLSVIDLNEVSNQPFFDNSKRLAIVFNGEIYNYQKIKHDLANDYDFKTTSDTEVVLASYLKWGADCLSKFNGMFAFAIWDKLKKELFVARDRVGIKPMYIYKKQGLFIFGSEVRALLATELIPKKINKKAVVDYLNYQAVHAPLSIIEGVNQLESGHFGIWDGTNFQTTKYWDISNTPTREFDFQDEGSVKAEVKELLLKSVERRLVSDVPLGAFLSGGIDSSAVVSLMAEISAQPISTFSIVFNESQYDESQFSSLIAKKYKTDHNPILLQPRHFLEQLPMALKAMDTPTGDGPNSYVVSKETRSAGITVALSGLGGDELFAGYPIFKQFSLLNKYSGMWAIPQQLRKLGSSVLNFSTNPKSARLKELLGREYFSFEQIYPTFRKLLSKSKLNSIVTGIPLNHNIVETLLGSQNGGFQQLPILSQVMIGELTSYTQNVLLKDTDQMSMASALEVRVPFLDHKLIEFVKQIPDKIKYPKFSKSLLVESLAPRLPDEIVHRRKMGFVLPWEKWMRQELKQFCQERIYGIANRSIFNEQAILNMWDNFIKKSGNISWMNIWLLIVLEEWLSSNEVN